MISAKTKKGIDNNGRSSLHQIIEKVNILYSILNLGKKVIGSCKKKTIDS